MTEIERDVLEALGESLRFHATELRFGDSRQGELQYERIRAAQDDNRVRWEPSKWFSGGVLDRSERRRYKLAARSLAHRGLVELADKMTWVAITPAGLEAIESLADAEVVDTPA
jgi:hypothetical protein